MSNKSITTKLKALIFFIALLPTLVVSLLFYQSSKTTISQSLARLNGELKTLNTLGESIDRQVKTVLDKTVSLTSSEKFVSGSVKDRYALIQDSYKSASGIRQVILFDKHGEKIIDYTLADTSEATGNLRFEDIWIRRAFAGEVSKSDVFFDKNNNPLITFTVPIFSHHKDQVTGAVCIYLSLREILGELSYPAGSSGIIYILDRQNRVIQVLPSPRQITLPVLGPSAALPDSETGRYALHVEEGIYYLNFSVPIWDSDMQLLWITPMSEITSYSRQALMNFLGAFIMSVLCSLLLTSYIVRKISHPLEELAKATQEFVESGLKVKMDTIDSPEEVGELAASLHQLQNRWISTQQKSEDMFALTTEKLAQRELELNTIQSVTETFSSLKDFSQLTEYIVKKAREVIGASFCTLYYRGGNGKMVLTSRSSEGKTEVTLENLPVFPLAHELFADMESTLEPCILQEINPDFPLPVHLYDAPISSYCVFPLHTGEGLFGVLEIGFERKKILSRVNLRLMTTLARSASIAIENAQLYRNMTDDKNKMEAVLGSISDGVVSIDRSCVITSFNAAAEKITGFKAEDVIGKPCKSVFCGYSGEMTVRKSCPETGCLLLAAKDPKKFPLQTEHFVKRPDGKEIYLQFTTTLGKEETDERAGYVSIFRDISKLKELEQLRCDFVDTVSHELRTPLTSIKGYIATMLHPRAKFTPEESTGFLKIINEEADRLNRMITDLLEASRLHRDALTIKLQVTKIHETILSVVLRKKARSTIHTFETKLDESLVAFADPQQIDFVLNHLVENAIKYSPNGGKIKLQTLAPNEDNIMVIIEDEGIGVPEDHKDKIFNLFHRVDMSSTRRIYGPGLGLFLAKKIIEAHGKNIWVESSLTGGSRFVFQLPRHIEPAAPEGETNLEVSCDETDIADKTDQIDTTVKIDNVLDSQS